MCESASWWWIPNNFDDSLSLVEKIERKIFIIFYGVFERENIRYTFDIESFVTYTSSISSEYFIDFYDKQDQGGKKKIVEWAFHVFLFGMQFIIPSRESQPQRSYTLHVGSNKCLYDVVNVHVKDSLFLSNLRLKCWWLEVYDKRNNAYNSGLQLVD